MSPGIRRFAVRLRGIERNFFARLALVFASMTVFGCIGWSAMMHSRENGRRTSCQSSLRQMAFGLSAYRQDYDDKWPLARGDGIPDNPGFGWSGSTQPYLKCTQILQCASEIHPPANTTGGRGFSDYWMNSRVCGRDSTDITKPQTVILVGDGDGGAPDSDASYNKREFPANWRSMQGDGQPPWFLRHTGGANYSFVDGHVKWLQSEQVANGSGQPFTVAIR